ncbi:MAG: hypothetical protein V4674_03025 [Patescibacteria group bacterium]
MIPFAEVLATVAFILVFVLSCAGLAMPLKKKGPDVWPNPWPAASDTDPRDMWEEPDDYNAPGD